MSRMTLGSNIEKHKLESNTHLIWKI